MAVRGPEADFYEFDQNGLWGEVYQRIRLEASLNNAHSLKDARKPENRTRNRYRDVSPYDHSRVRLCKHDLDYINASLVDAPEADRKYILTQGPLPNTSGHFWLMVWEQDSRAVLMLNRVIEKGQVKCHQYFPVGGENEGEDELTFDEVGLKVTYVSEEKAANFTVRTLQVTEIESGKTKEVLQFHYTTWPDFGVPESPAAFLNFLMAVRESGALDSDVGPPIIHCSAGIGRSGTFCLVDTCLILVETSQSTDDLDVREVLMNMRQFRMGLIQTPDQLRFSYLAIIQGANVILGRSTPDDLDLIESNHNHLTNKPVREPPPIPMRNASNSQGEHNGVPDATEVDSHAEAEALRELQRKMGADVRRRKREERVKSTSAQLQRMKEKQKEADQKKGFFSRLRPYVLSVSVLVVISGVLFYRYYWSDTPASASS